MVTYYMVTLNGHPLKRWLEKPEADAMAERWQGSHGGYRGGSGLLRIKDRGDHVEVKEDREANKEFTSGTRWPRRGISRRSIMNNGWSRSRRPTLP